MTHIYSEYVIYYDIMDMHNDKPLKKEQRNWKIQNCWKLRQSVNNNLGTHVCFRVQDKYEVYLLAIA
jgi:hypothetical protein